MGALTDIGPHVTLDPAMAFERFEAEGESYVRYKFQGRLYDNEWSNLAALWLAQKEQARSNTGRQRSFRRGTMWIFLIAAGFAATGIAILVPAWLFALFAA